MNEKAHFLCTGTISCRSEKTHSKNLKRKKNIDYKKSTDRCSLWHIKTEALSIKAFAAVTTLRELYFYEKGLGI